MATKQPIKEKPMSIRFYPGVKEASYKLALRRGTTLTALIEGLLRDELKKENIEIEVKSKKEE